MISVVEDQQTFADVFPPDVIQSTRPTAMNTCFIIDLALSIQKYMIECVYELSIRGIGLDTIPSA